MKPLYASIDLAVCVGTFSLTARALRVRAGRPLCLCIGWSKRVDGGEDDDERLTGVCGARRGGRRCRE